MHQESYINKIIDKFDINCCVARVPISQYIVIKAVKDNDEIMDSTLYRSMIGSLLFLATRSRPDILFATILMSQYCNKPGLFHMKILKQIFSYINQTKDYAINLSNASDDCIEMYTDSSWASDQDDRKSFNGDVLLVGKVPIYWSCGKQKVVTLSSMEAEYIAIANSATTLSWFKNIVNDCNDNCIDISCNLPILYSDSLSAIHFSRNCFNNHRSRHIDIKFHYVRECLKSEIFNLKYVSSKLNLADILTKSFSSAKIVEFCKLLFGGQTSHHRGSM